MTDSEKIGTWILHSVGHGSKAIKWAECSECNVCGSPQRNRCPVCEAKMKTNNFDPDSFLGEYEEEYV